MALQKSLKQSFETQLMQFIKHSPNDTDGLKSLLIEELPKNECNYGKLLHQAARWNSEVATRHLIALGTELDYLAQDGETPLTVAMYNQRFTTMKILLESNASIDVVNARGENALQIMLNMSDVLSRAVEFGMHSEFFQTFYEGMKNRRPILEEFSQKLLDAGFSLYHTAFSNDTELLEHMLTHGLDINSRSALGMTALHGAAALGNLQLAEWLVERGADVNALDGFGRGPLFPATWNCNASMLEFLLKQGADPNLQDHVTESTPLYSLFDYSEAETVQMFNDCVELLLQHGAVPQNSITNLTMFDHALIDDQLSHGIDCVIAQVAILEKLGTTNARSVMHCGEERHQWKIPEYEKCLERYLQLLEIGVLEKLSLLDLMGMSDSEIRSLVRNDNLDLEVEKVCREHDLEKSCPYYFKTITRPIANAVELLELQEKGILVICKIFDSNYNLCCNFAIQVLGYLDKRELKQLCQVL